MGNAQMSMERILTKETLIRLRDAPVAKERLTERRTVDSRGEQSKTDIDRMARPQLLAARTAQTNEEKDQRVSN